MLILTLKMEGQVKRTALWDTISHIVHCRPLHVARTAVCTL